MISSTPSSSRSAGLSVWGGLRAVHPYQGVKEIPSWTSPLSGEGEVGGYTWAPPLRLRKPGPDRSSPGRGPVKVHGRPGTYSSYHISGEDPGPRHRET